MVLRETCISTMKRSKYHSKLAGSDQEVVCTSSPLLSLQHEIDKMSSNRDYSSVNPSSLLHLPGMPMENLRGKCSTFEQICNQLQPYSSVQACSVIFSPNWQ